MQHGYPSLSHGAPKFMPWFVCSVTDHATPVHNDCSIKSITWAPSDSASSLPSDDARWASSDSAFPRHSPAPPLPLDFQPPPSPPPPLPHANSETHRHVTSSCLTTPACLGTHTSATSCLLCSALPSLSGLSGSWGTDSPSPTSHASLAVGSTADCLARPCTSEDRVLEGRPTAREHLGYTSCNRNCSHSIANAIAPVSNPFMSRCLLLSSCV
jgi:hypothetical protein